MRTFALAALVGTTTAAASNATATTTAGTPASNGGPIFSGYFANWAQYHKAPYKHVASDLAPIAGRVDRFLYSFAYFCPPAGTSPMPYWAKAPYGSCTDANEFQLMSVETKDTEMIADMVGFKAQNPALKVLLSVGGWNFPSEYFSKMVASPAARAKWVASAKQWISSKGFDGIDIDWEYPCSPPRSNPVEISCTEFDTVADKGGNCPADKNNLPLLLQELRAALGAGKEITIASQAAKKNWVNMNLEKSTPFIDAWHIMSYDYSVSDIGGANMTAGNAPLYAPGVGAGEVKDWSIDYSVQGYLKAGVPAAKIHLGVPFYGHTWYAPGLSAASASKFGVAATVQGQCCGPFKSTFGAKAGIGSQQCGTMMYSEILAAAPTSTFDTKTQSAIGYFEKAGSDAGYTQAGTWVSYNDARSMAAITKYAVDNKLGGMFIFDTSMDTMSGGRPTYTLMNQIADGLGGHPAPSPTPAPAPGPTPAGTCHSINPGVTDAWCNTNCHAATPFCPAADCVCT